MSQHILIATGSYKGVGPSSMPQKRPGAPGRSPAGTR
jgi:hypothetical protein